jgi:hypothetical protein
MRQRHCQTCRCFPPPATITEAWEVSPHKSPPPARAQRLEPAERSFLVGLDQAGIAGDIGREDRCKPTFDASWPNRLHDGNLTQT